MSNCLLISSYILSLMVMGDIMVHKHNETLCLMTIQYKKDVGVPFG
jgi:hypothetical protein